MKKCTDCQELKQLSEFHKEKHGKFGVKSKCKVCCINKSRLWKLSNSSREKNNRRTWNVNNADRHRSATLSWRAANQERHIAYAKKYNNDRKKTDTKFKLLSSVRSLVYNHIVNRDFKKRDRIETLLGCRFDDFLLYIENQFQPEMSWENYGDIWTLDHVCPCNQSKNESELLKLQYFKNWSPCYKRDNLIKGDKKTQRGELLCIELLERGWL